METKMKKNILVIDGQGGGMGKHLVSAIKAKINDVQVMAVGTNSAAASAMHKAGADMAATGENAVIVACRKADIIVGPLGIVIADSLCGEISPKMSVAVGQSEAKKILVPANRCGNIVVGVEDTSMSKLIDRVIDEITREVC
jgi:hypothetical protein